MAFLAGPTVDLRNKIYHHLQCLLSLSIYIYFLFFLTSVDAVANKPLVKTICINKTGSKRKYNQREVPLKYE